MTIAESHTDTGTATLRTLLDLSASEVFEMMVGSRLEKSGTYEGVSEFDTTAMIGLAGSICGVISVRCKISAAAAIASKMVGAEVSSDDGSARDALAEVVNMIAGNFKSKLSGSSQCMLSIPTVITGADYQLRTPAVSEQFHIMTNFGEYPLSICMELHG